ncbi:hypothetical protein B0H13DRAFT_2378167 [Mycena leptocephala]|nr:hypothetical protein B0H13DRAFT_2378167 [Mycena leptocephala]
MATSTTTHPAPDACPPARSGFVINEPDDDEVPGLVPMEEDHDLGWLVRSHRPIVSTVPGTEPFYRGVSDLQKGERWANVDYHLEILWVPVLACDGVYEWSANHCKRHKATEAPPEIPKR